MKDYAVGAEKSGPQNEEKDRTSRGKNLVKDL